MPNISRRTFIGSSVALGVCGPRAALAAPADRFLADGQTVVLEADAGEGIAALSARILAYDDTRRFPRLKRIVLLGRDRAAAAVKAFADLEKWPAFKARYPRVRLDYALVGGDVGNMTQPFHQTKETRSHVFARAREDDRMRLFLEGAPFDPSKPVCKFWDGPDMTAAQVVDALPVPDWVDREIDATKARIDAWKGSDEVVLVPTITDFHFYSPACGVWPDFPSVAASKLAHAKYLKRVIERLGADAGANLGDLGFDYCPRHWSHSLDNERAARLAIEDAIYASLKVPFVMVPGNHDAGWDSPTGFGDRFNSPAFPRTRNYRRGPTGAYGYLDLAAKRTRLFFVNTSEGGNGGEWRIRPDQVDFHRKAVAATPDGWTVAFFSHDCLHRTAGDRDWKERTGCKASKTYCDMRALLESIAAGKRLKLAGAYCGDSHMNRLHEENGVRYFVCDAAFNGAGPKNLLVHVAAINPRTGEGRLFRIGARGAKGDL